MSADLSVAVQEHERSTVVHVEGELDLGSARRLEAAIGEAHRGGAQLLVVNVERLQFIDMAGVRVLLAAQELAQETGRTLILANVRDPIRRTLALAEVDDLLGESA